MTRNLDGECYPRFLLWAVVGIKAAHDDAFTAGRVQVNDGLGYSLLKRLYGGATY